GLEQEFAYRFNIKECLNRFCKFSGEKVNFDKSSMVFSGKVKASVRSDVGGRLQIPVVSDLGTYLGVPVASGRLTKDRYKFLLDKVANRLRGWHAKMLSMPGRNSSHVIGRHTLFWDQCWLLNEPLSAHVIGPIPEPLVGATVDELWEETDWKWRMLEGVLHHDHLQMLRAHKLAPEGSIRDTFFWNKTPNGKFTTSSALRVLRGDESSLPAPIWKYIWSTPCQQRIRQFLYLVVHQAVLCNQERYRCHMSSVEKCPRCPSAESLLHMLRDCPRIKATWLAISGNSLPSGFFALNDVREWVVRNVKNKDLWSTTFAYMVWHAWKCRNHLTFNGTDDISQLSTLVTTMVQTFRSALSSQPVPRPQPPCCLPPRSIAQGTWSIPPIGWVSLAVDGSATGNPIRAGGGGVFRDHHGTFLSAFTFQCGSYEAFRAELWALFHGIRRAKELGVNRVHVECDASQVVQTLKTTELKVHPHLTLIKLCKELLAGAWEVRIVQIKRTANRAADCLAIRCYDFDKFTIFNSVPTFLSHTLMSDYVASFETNST
ncbi:hypothetical protein V2J09_024264, partial [Rumex salicifolius]